MNLVLCCNVQTQEEIHLALGKLCCIWPLDGNAIVRSLTMYMSLIYHFIYEYECYHLIYVYACFIYHIIYGYECYISLYLCVWVLYTTLSMYMSIIYHFTSSHNITCDIIHIQSHNDIELAARNYTACSPQMAALYLGLHPSEWLLLYITCVTFLNVFQENLLACCILIAMLY